MKTHQTSSHPKYKHIIDFKCETHEAPRTCCLLLSSDANTFDCPLVERCWRAHHREEIRTIQIAQNYVFVFCFVFLIQTVK